MVWDLGLDYRGWGSESVGNISKDLKGIRYIVKGLKGVGFQM
jgi:hypothetical protein